VNNTIQYNTIQYSTTNAHSETGQIAVCCQNLTLGALSSRSTLSVLVGALFKKFFEHALYTVERNSQHSLSLTNVCVLPEFVCLCVCWLTIYNLSFLL
jgi:hypothetical protein